MQKCFQIFLLLFLVPAGAHAALPPQYQNADDLDAMVRFIKAHPRVAESLRAIDFENKVVLYDKDCRAEFAREKKTDEMPGPLPPLIFHKSNCPVK